MLALPVTPGPNHDGGMLLLGPSESGLAGDGRPLYAVIGDLNRSGQLQNISTGVGPDDTGVIFRVEQDGTAHPLNPFFPYCSTATTTTCTDNAGYPSGQTCITNVAKYCAYGVRNSFGLAIDPVTGKLWNTENGPSSYDEVNQIEPGFNSGWSRIMGPVSRDLEGLADLFNMPGTNDSYSDPEFSWLATIAPTAIVFPFGGALGAAYGQRRVGRVTRRRRCTISAASKSTAGRTTGARSSARAILASSRLSIGDRQPTVAVEEVEPGTSGCRRERQVRRAPAERGSGCTGKITRSARCVCGAVRLSEHNAGRAN